MKDMAPLFVSACLSAMALGISAWMVIDGQDKLGWMLFLLAAVLVAPKSGWQVKTERHVVVPRPAPPKAG